MKQSGKNILFRSALLLFNTALLGSVAAHMHFGFDLRDLLAAAADAPKNGKASTPKDGPGSKKSKVDLTGPIVPAKKSSEDMIRVQRDGSRVSRMEDGYGNSTVTRNFSDHKLLRMILVRFKASGERTVFVYGKNGEVKSLPKNYHDRVLAASADEIAAAAKIFDSQNPNEQRKQRLAILRQRIGEQRRELQKTAPTLPRSNDRAPSAADPEFDQADPED